MSNPTLSARAIAVNLLRSQYWPRIGAQPSRDEIVKAVRGFFPEGDITEIVAALATILASKEEP